MTWFDRLVWDRTKNREALTLEQLLLEEARPTAAGESVTVESALRLSTVGLRALAGRFRLHVAAARLQGRRPGPHRSPAAAATPIGPTFPSSPIGCGQ
jgi:hypothetical protein